jgi:hypothetical protein
VPVDIRQALVEELGRLQTGQSFHIVEFSADGVVVWNVHRDRNGVPRATRWQPLHVDPDDDTVRDDPRIRRLGEHRPVIFVRTSPDQPPDYVLEPFRKFDPDRPILECGDGFEDKLRESIIRSPLTHSYELVLLRKTRGGRLYFEPRRLFAEETVSPRTKRITIRCLRSDGRGVVFAIVTTEGARDFELLSLQSADLTPGDYELTAQLVRPGLVRLDGLPGMLRTDHRTWGELLDSVPKSLPVPTPAHLICLIEVAGTSEQIHRRVDMIRELVRSAAGSDAPLQVSLVTYGAHSFERGVPDEAAHDLVWAGPSVEALAALDALEQYQPITGDYRYAAQLECALALIRPKVRPADGRPVLLMVGSRPAFPPRHDARMGLLPCPRRVDWRPLLAELSRSHPELVMGAIYDRDTRDLPGWRHLGRDAVSTSDVFEAHQFATQLGIGGAAVTIPFPMIAPDGG